MNVFEEAQKARPEIDGAEENMAAARAMLMAEIRGESVPVPARVGRRPWIIAGSVLAGAAAVTAGVLIAGGLTTPDPSVEAFPTAVPSTAPSPSAEPQPTPQPTAGPLTVTSAFGAAGAAAASFSGLTVAPGQYLRLEVAVQDVVFFEPANGWGEYSADRSNATSAWGVTGSYDVYIPADPYADWRYAGTPSQIGDLYGPDAAQRSQLYQQETAHTSYEPYGQAGGAGAPWSTAGGDSLAAFFDSMPRDPAQLISWIDEHQETPPGADDSKVGWLLIELLARNAGSPEARSAMYAALSMLDGFELIDVAGDDFTVALTTPTVDISGNPSTVRRTATIDTITGLVEETTVTTGSGSAVVPDAVPDSRRTYVVSVVDAAP
jgi:hypothetical protein